MLDTEPLKTKETEKSVIHPDFYPKPHLAHLQMLDERDSQPTPWVPVANISSWCLEGLGDPGCLSRALLLSRSPERDSA